MSIMCFWNLETLLFFLSFSLPLSTRHMYLSHFIYVNIFTIKVCVPIATYVMIYLTQAIKMRCGVKVNFFHMWLLFKHFLHEKWKYTFTRSILHERRPLLKNGFMIKWDRLILHVVVPLLQNYNGCFQILMPLGNPTEKKQFSFLNSAFPKCILPWTLIIFARNAT